MDLLTIFSRSLAILIVSSFMPLTAISFFKFMMEKKDNDYRKTKDQMGLKSTSVVVDTFKGSKYILPVVFATFICMFAITNIAFADYSVNNPTDNLFFSGSNFGLPEMSKDAVAQGLMVVGFAFMGAFIWSAGTIILRLIAYDLLPSVYYSAGIRLIMAPIVALILAFILPGEGSIVSLKASFPAIAFLTGMFPERVLTYLIKRYKDFVNAENELNTIQLSLDRIEGMSMRHRERLEEVGIDNAENLASASLTQLMIGTPYEGRQLLDWIGQAKFLVYVKDNIDAFRKMGIRSVYDFFSPEKTPESLSRIAEAGGIDNTFMQNIASQIRNDTGICSLNTFYNNLNNKNSDQNSDNSAK